MRTEKTCHHLEWLVPKLITQMELSASDNLELVTKALISIFQNFIKVVETNHDHLKPQREMIIGAAQRVVKFYYTKGDTFSLDSHHMDVLMGISKRVRATLKELVVDGLNHNFYNVKSSMAELYVYALLENFGEEGHNLLLNWIKTKVIAKRDKPEPAGSNLLTTDNFKYGTFLKLNNITEIEFEIQEGRTGSNYATIISALGQSAYKLSDEVFALYLKLGVAYMEESGISGSKILTMLFKHYTTRYYGCTSTYRMILGIEKNQVK